MKKIRISGLVKAAQWTREQLAAGIPPDEARKFRGQVEKTVRQVEAICREHQIRPQDLPAPSYRAYRFLKDLDLDHLPEPTGPAPQPAKKIYITNVVASQRAVNGLFFDWVMAHPDETITEDHPQVQEFARLLAEEVADIEGLAEGMDGTPGHLPTPSRRAYQWQKFLSEPSALMAHLKTLRALLKEFHHPRCDARVPRQVRQRPVMVEFVYTSYLYRAREKEDGLHVAVHEGFLGAPTRVLRALACAVLLKKRELYRTKVAEFAAGEAFAEIVTALELTTEEVEPVTQGRYFDLEEVFERVNATCFAGELSRPELTWNRMITGRKLGHYDPLRDTVMVSVTLDAPGVPDYVVDYVMYHELLHRKLGIDVVNGRRYAHTSEFRAAEERFPHYAEAQAFLRTFIPGSES